MPPYDPSDPEFSEATVLQNLVDRARHYGYTEEEIHRIEDEVSTIWYHIYYIINP